MRLNQELTVTASVVLWALRGNAEVYVVSKTTHRVRVTVWFGMFVPEETIMPS